MTNEELMARAAEAARAESEQMSNTLLVDVHCKTTRSEIKDAVDDFAEVIGLTPKYMVDDININTPASKFKSALTAVRLSKRPEAIMLVTNDYINVSDWIETYQNNGITVYVHFTGTTVVYTAEEYINDYAKEMILDKILKSRQCCDRTVLEDFAELFSEAVGWKFSRPIRERKLTAASFDLFKPYETLPYAGRFDYYYKDQLFEADAPSGKTVVTLTLKSRLLAGQGVPVAELIGFRDFLLAIHEFGIEDYLEPGWAICGTCGNPVRTEGMYEAKACTFCDTIIPDYFAVDINMPAKDYDMILFIREHRAEIEQQHYDHPRSVARRILRSDLGLNV